MAGCSALGDIAFSFTFSLILLEIQSTLKTPPSQKETMKKASSIAIFTTSFFYLCCGGCGYAAFGDSTPGNLLTGFGFYEPFWLIDFGNACIVLHLVGGYQIYSQTLFAIVERWYAEKFPESMLARERDVRVCLFITIKSVNPVRICFRTIYVILTMSVGMMFPYFNQVVAFAGINKEPNIQSLTPLRFGWGPMTMYQSLSFSLLLTIYSAVLN
ncbi:unnamed protein product [Lactuca saligna]|uniref:Amino acid transporter transmembrane domain-containing protein n=1 Tax=Lactuca saligna TaxID=75948 RepID=A0AA35Z0H0_LACSI|nr:unnamed protein product [Lactuca saligna]